MDRMTEPASLKARAFRPDWRLRLIWVALAAYVLYAASRLDFTWARFVVGLDRGQAFLGRMFPPEFTRWELLVSGLLESLQIAIIASFIGILLSLPIGLMAARNLMPVVVTVPARALIAVARSFHPIIIAIIFVKAIGFGALAGIFALILASIGFVAKLFAEAIEEISLKQVEAVRATGASFMGVVIMGVLPQVLARFIGFSTYQLDSNLRNSTMVGIVGGGGIGGTLFSAFQR
ncbi:MAG: phosphonate ABC transporter, permease protein PhnE, partial [Geminicoccaceae bacterium]